MLCTRNQDLKEIPYPRSNVLPLLTVGWVCEYMCVYLCVCVDLWQMEPLFEEESYLYVMCIQNDEPLDPVGQNARSIDPRTKDQMENISWPVCHSDAAPAIILHRP